MNQPTVAGKHLPIDEARQQIRLGRPPPAAPRYPLGCPKRPRGVCSASWGQQLLRQLIQHIGACYDSQAMQFTPDVAGGSSAARSGSVR